MISFKSFFKKGKINSRLLTLLPRVPNEVQSTNIGENRRKIGNLILRSCEHRRDSRVVEVYQHVHQLSKYSAYFCLLFFSLLSFYFLLSALRKWGNSDFSNSRLGRLAWDKERYPLSWFRIKKKLWDDFENYSTVKWFEELFNGWNVSSGTDW